MESYERPNSENTRLLEEDEAYSFSDVCQHMLLEIDSTLILI